MDIPILDVDGDGVFVCGQTQSHSADICIPADPLPTRADFDSPDPANCSRPIKIRYYKRTTYSLYTSAGTLASLCFVEIFLPSDHPHARFEAAIPLLACPW